MPPPLSSSYRAMLVRALSAVTEPESVRSELTFYQGAVQVLLSLDLEPARPVLESCYADRPRGQKRRDPVAMLRTLLLAILVGETSLNVWPRRIQTSLTLRLLCGWDAQDRGPGVGTLYDFLHRLHDGGTPTEETPSAVERRAAKAEQPGPRQRKSNTKKRRRKRSKKAQEEEVAAEQAHTSRQVVTALRRAPEAENPIDLMDRLQQVLLAVAVKPSAARGLLGDVSKLVVGGDGSSLPTGACGLGVRLESCEHHKFERCTCNRRYADPDARRGYDKHRNAPFFGHRFYEATVSTAGHDLPLTVAIAAGNVSDVALGPRTLDRCRRTLRDHTDWAIDIVTLDAGHDAQIIHEWCYELGFRAVMPLARDAPATVPTRPDLRLSTKGIPLCEAGVEMGAWGSAGAGRANYICPLKTGLECCPLAPEDQPDWRCRPDLKHGPTTAVKTADNPRLFPAIQRNSATYATLRRLRSGCERSYSLKKGKYKLIQARHRRQSFWLIRLYLISVLQHAAVWVQGMPAAAFLDELLQDAGLVALAAK